MKVLTLVLTLIAGIMSGCASYSTYMLDEYIDINSDGDMYKNTVETLTGEVKTLINRGDSLIVMYESTLEMNEISPKGISSNVESFILDVEKIEKDILWLNQDLRKYDHSTIRFLEIINGSKSRHLKRVQIDIYRHQINIKKAMIEIDPQFVHLSLTQDNLVELTIMMESQVKLTEMEAALHQLEKEMKRGNH